MKRWWKWTVAKLKDRHGWWGSDSPEPPQQQSQQSPGWWSGPARPPEYDFTQLQGRMPAPPVSGAPVAGGPTDQPAGGAPAAGAGMMTRGHSPVGPTWGMNSSDYWKYQQQLRKLGFLR